MNNLEDYLCSISSETHYAKEVYHDIKRTRAERLDLILDYTKSVHRELVLLAELAAKLRAHESRANKLAEAGRSRNAIT